MEEGTKLALEEIKAHCLCRIEQVEGVYSIFADDTTMESLFVYGNTATGKTMLIKTMLHKLQVMTLDCPEDYSVELYKSFCSAVVDVFFHVGRDLNELRHLAMLNFPKYCEPISEGEVEQTDYRKLWMLITPVLRKALQSVYLREVSSKQWESMQQQNNAVLPTAEYSTKGEVELPYYSKYLLLASFFASYNPATTDRRFFAKKTAGRLSTRTKRAVKTAKKQNKKFIGPKAFQIDRLMAIFYSIVEGCVSPSANILSQLATLTTLKLLVKTSADDQIDLPKYKCVVPVEFAVSIGKQVDIDVHQYLYDL